MGRRWVFRADAVVGFISRQLAFLKASLSNGRLDNRSVGELHGKRQVVTAADTRIFDGAVARPDVQGAVA